ncbi:uncharacterized protein RAG0_12701 [Rhynchosporium agropyri]|uniref:Uncharacterized protein n=1 Tax=Rhynchosporium agropyri TaxID=914238 RepID=A0A1E1L992_9HELO|nr:uncharacterized protein RAG0_12701 [Rhynchosporium agropyri]
MWRISEFCSGRARQLANRDRKRDDVSLGKVRDGILYRHRCLVDKADPTLSLFLPPSIPPPSSIT